MRDGEKPMRSVKRRPRHLSASLVSLASTGKHPKNIVLILICVKDTKLFVKFFVLRCPAPKKKPIHAKPTPFSSLLPSIIFKFQIFSYSARKNN